MLHTYTNRYMPTCHHKIPHQSGVPFVDFVGKLVDLRGQGVASVIRQPKITLSRIPRLDSATFKISALSPARLVSLYVMFFHRIN